MKEPNKLWRDLCLRFAEQSRCRSRKVGCIIVKNNVLCGEGWNSPSAGSCAEDCARCVGDYKRGENLELAECAHAEANAIGHCARHGTSIEGASIYCTHFCCKWCADIIISSGIKEYYYMEEYPGWERVRDRLHKASVFVKKLRQEKIY